MASSLHLLLHGTVILPNEPCRRSLSLGRPGTEKGLEENHLEPVVRVMSDGIEAQIVQMDQQTTFTHKVKPSSAEKRLFQPKRARAYSTPEKDSVVERLFTPDGKAADPDAITRDTESNTPSPLSNQTNERVVKKESRELSAYERVVELLTTNPQYQKEVILGKRVGFYKIGKELGSGNFSKVKMGLHILTKEKVAIKVMEKNKMDSKSDKLLRREIENMEKVNHLHIIRLFEVIETLTKLYFVLEFAGGGELYEHVIEKGRMQEVEAKLIFAQILSAVTHMHEKGIIHRDIKAENVFIASPGYVKLGDLGFSTHFKGDTMLTTFCGSPPYAAPELFRDKSYRGEFVDIWALGVLLYFIVTGNVPFRGETISDLKEQILDGYFSTPDFVSPDCTNLINRILRMEPMKRLSIADISEHEWLQGIKIPETPNTRKDTGTAVLSFDEEKQNEMYKKVNSTMESFGIDRKLLLESADRGVRSPIIGTYRIVLFMQQQLEEGRLTKEEESQELNSFRKTDSIESKRNRSKACSIL